MAQVARRVFQLVAVHHFKVQVGAGGAAGVANFGNQLAALHDVALADMKFAGVGVAADQAVLVVDSHKLAIFVVVAGEDDATVAGREDRRARGRAQVETGVVGKTAGDRIGFRNRC